MTEYQKFTSLQDFIAHCADPAANGTGGARLDFVMSVTDEPVGPEAGQATMRVLTIAPRNFDYMAQRFAFDLTGGDTLIANDAIEDKRAFLLSEARAAAKTEAVSAPVNLPGGVQVARIGGGQ